jgi:hypothetical protein
MHRNPNSKKKRKNYSSWSEWDIDMSYNSTKTHASPPLNHHELVTTLHHHHPKDKAVKTKSPSSPLVPSLPMMSHTE